MLSKLMTLVCACSLSGAAMAQCEIEQDIVATVQTHDGVVHLPAPNGSDVHLDMPGLGCVHVDGFRYKTFIFPGLTSKNQTQIEDMLLLIEGNAMMQDLLPLPGPDELGD